MIVQLNLKGSNNVIIALCLGTLSLPELTILSFSLSKCDSIAEVVFHFLRVGQRRPNRTMNGRSNLDTTVIIFFIMLEGRSGLLPSPGSFLLPSQFLIKLRKFAWFNYKNCRHFQRFTGNIFRRHHIETIRGC